MFAFTLVCTDPCCGAMLEVFSPGTAHDVDICPYCRTPLLDASFLDPDGSPSDDDRVQVVIRAAPRPRAGVR